MRLKRRSLVTLAPGLAATLLPLSVQAAEVLPKIRLLIIGGIHNHD